LGEVKVLSTEKKSSRTITIQERLSHAIEKKTKRQEKERNLISLD